MSEGGDWVPAGTLAELGEGRPTRVKVGDEEALVYRFGDRLFAVGSRCTHQRAPLDRGLVHTSGGLVTVTCPAHGSMYGLADGRVLRGPSATPLPRYETRVTDGTVEVRPLSG
ncbi:MAG: Rieske (2Fe-2S) protein [Actinobacteria bacterium]|nr:Rieske (2Fe-2S) protein [Actinomycetota bacterium]